VGGEEVYGNPNIKMPLLSAKLHGDHERI